MEDIRYGKDGKPIKTPEKEIINSLMEKIYGLATRKYSLGCPLDTMEEIIIDRVKFEDKFDCSREHISKTILSTDDVAGQEFMSLLAGPYPKYRKTSLKIFSQKLSNILYENGSLKEEIISIVFAIILKEMKNRFSANKEYVYSGIEGIREEGVITLK